MNKNFYTERLLADETVKLDRGENDAFGALPLTFEEALDYEISYIGNCLSYHYIKDLKDLTGLDVVELMMQKELIMETLIGQKDTMLLKLENGVDFKTVLTEWLNFAQLKINA